MIYLALYVLSNRWTDLSHERVQLEPSRALNRAASEPSQSLLRAEAGHLDRCPITVPHKSPETNLHNLGF